MKIKYKSNLVKKNWLWHKVNETEKKITDHKHDKHITIPEFDKLTAENFAARLAKLLQIKQSIYFLKFS